MFRATGPSGATPSSGGICASAVVVMVIADDDVIAATGEITAEDDEDTSACNGAEGEGAAIELVMAFTVDVVLLMLLLML